MSKAIIEGFDVTDNGARKEVYKFIREKLYVGMCPYPLPREKAALQRAGHNPNDYMLIASRVGDTGIFFKFSFSEPILVNGNGEVRDLNGKE